MRPPSKQSAVEMTANWSNHGRLFLLLEVPELCCGETVEPEGTAEAAIGAEAFARCSSWSEKAAFATVADFFLTAIFSGPFLAKCSKPGSMGSEITDADQVRKSR